MKHILRFLVVPCLILVFSHSALQAQLVLPWTEDFENVGPDTTFTSSQFVLNGLSGTGYSWGYFRPTTLEARLRFNAGAGFANSGSYAATLDDTLSNTIVSTNELILNCDLTSYVGQSVQLGFSYMSHNEDRHPGDSIWVRASFIDPWIGIYDLFANRGPDGVYTDVTGLNISAALTNAGQSLGQFVQIRFGQQDNANASSLVGVDGMSFDDVTLSVIPPIDGGVIAVRPPDPGCGLGTEPIEVDIRNFGGDTLFSVPVGIIINGAAPITATINNIAIPPAGVYTHRFTPGFNFSTVGPYTLEIWTNLNGDFDNTNDTSTAITFHNPVVNTYPYRDDFESNPQSWIPGGTLSSWVLTTPSMPTINSAASGVNSWVTQNGSSTTTFPNRTDGHNDLEQSFVESQSCFDFSGLAAPVLRLDVWWDCETFADGAAILSSVDSGQTWQLVGSAAGTGTNWYNQPFINGAPGNQLQGWSGDFIDGSGGWITAEHPLTNLAGEPDVRFRVVFGSDFSITNDGFAFDNFTIYEIPQQDGSVTVLNTPRSDCGLTANERIAVRVNNRGLGQLTNIPLAYRINGGPAIVRETWNNANITPGAFGNYTFNTLADLSIPGVYTIEVWTEIPADPLQFNDTFTTQIFHNQFISSYPYLDDFEGPTTNWTSGGLPNSWERTTPNLNVINRPAGGQQSWVTSRGFGAGNGGYSDNEQSFVVAGNCFDLGAIANPRVRMDVWWHSEDNSDGAALQSSINGGLTWQPVGAVGSGTNWYNSAALTGVPGGQPEGWAGTLLNSSGGWLTADHPLTGLGGQPNVRFRVVFGSDFITADDGFAFDNFIVYSVVPRDAEVDSLVAPLATSCALGAAQAISIRIANSGTGTLNTIPVAYQVNGGMIVRDTLFNASLGGGTSTNFTFTTPSNFSAFGAYTVKTWTEVTNDPNFFNDTLIATVNNLPVVNFFPYSEDFENGPGGWFSNGLNDPWEFGTPAGTVINSASSGVNSWMTGLTTPYRDNQDGSVESPCFDMSSLLFPMIRMDIWWETQSSTFSGDGAKVQYSTNGGATWRDLGGVDPDWYNASLIPSITSGAQIGWMGNQNLGDGSAGWLKVETLAPQLSGLPSVKLRVLFQSDRSFSGIDGVAIDNIQVLNAPADLRAARLISPVGGCGLGNAQICFDIYNASSTTFNNPAVFYQVNNGPTVVQLYNGSIAPNSTVQHCFTNSFNFGPPGSYDVKMWLSNVLDTVLRNDTIYTTVLSKTPVTQYPYIQTFDDTAFNLPVGTNNPGAPIIDLAQDWENLQTDDPQDWAVWTSFTSSRAGPPADHTTGNTQYLYVEDSGFENDSVVLISPCFDITGLANPEMRVWVYSEPTNAGNQLNEYSIDVINNGSIIYDVLGPRQNTGPAWQQDTVDLRPYTGVVGFRFRVNNNNQTFTQDIAIDDFEILDVFADDVGVVDILQPQDGTCAEPADSVYVVIRNFGTNTQLTFPIQVTTQGNSISINYANQFPSGAFDTVFIGTINTLGAAGLTQVQAWTNLNIDQNRASDTTTKLLNLINPPAAPVTSTDSLILCAPDSAVFYVQNADSNLNYIWYDRFANILSNEDTFRTSLLTQDSTVFVEASTGMNGLKISEIGLGNPDFVEVTNTSERVLDATGWRVYIGESRSPSIDIPVGVSWPLGVFQPGEVQFRDNNRNSLFYFGAPFNWFNLPNSGWAMIVDDQCNLVDYVVWGHTQNDVDDFAPVGISGCRSGVNLGNYWNGPAITATGFNGIGLQRVGDTDNHDAGDWLVITNAAASNPGVLNADLQTGCVSASSKIEILIAPTVGIGLTDQFVCGPATLDAGPGFSSYTWSTGATSQTITYSDTTFAAAVLVINRFGCQETDTAVLSASTIPVVDLGRDTAACTGFIIDGGNPGCDYIWSTGATNRIINFVGRPGANLIWVECTDPLTGCFSRDSVIVNIRPEPDAGLPSILALCDSGTLSVRPGVANFPLQWSTLETTPTIKVTSTGTYAVTVTDTVTGCSGLDSTNVTVSPSPSVDIGSEDTTVCAGVMLDAGTYPNQIFYDWTNLSTGQTIGTNQTINITAAGVYSVTITDFNQCQAIDSMDVIFIDPPTADFMHIQGATPFDVDFTNASVGTGMTYSWDFDDGNTSSMENPTHTYTFAGTYIPCLTVTDSCGNSDQYCDTIDIGLVSIEPVGLAAQLNIYPSPVTNVLTVDAGQYGSDLEIELLDVRGSVLYRATISANSNKPEKIDMTDFAEGVYFVKLRSEQGILSRKILKGN